ncbi:OmpA family protein [Sneathiella glossodoripedis]|uniref:OmpA family protein n=1 Tax=Sneathiella glossodoripedis TaxID=418853 RepID=UPI000471F197|nr:OmpA family protein [Sneathiella glossodoripedis]
MARNKQRIRTTDRQRIGSAIALSLALTSFSPMAFSQTVIVGGGNAAPVTVNMNGVNNMQQYVLHPRQSPFTKSATPAQPQASVDYSKPAEIRYGDEVIKLVPPGSQPKRQAAPAPAKPKVTKPKPAIAATPEPKKITAEKQPSPVTEAPKENKAAQKAEAPAPAPAPAPAAPTAAKAAEKTATESAKNVAAAPSTPAPAKSAAKPKEAAKPQTTAAPAAAPKPAPKEEPASAAASTKPAETASNAAAPAELKPAEKAQKETAKEETAPREKDMQVAALPKEQTTKPAAKKPVIEPIAKADDNTINRILFDEGETQLPSSAVAKLETIAKSMNTDSDRIQLVAYANASSNGTARRLSLGRALMIRSKLMEMGVPNNKIEVRALGRPEDDSPADRVDLKLVAR